MPFDKNALLEAMKKLPLGEVKLMEVCGTHTMAIAKSGIKSMLPDNISLLSGPGCPVCVTPPQVIDAILELSMRPDVIITSYGDMLRVPGSKRGDSLLRRRALGAKVEMVYSPLDAIDIAEMHPDKEVVFLGVGFETTAPGTALAVLEAKNRGLTNFSLLSLLKLTTPALRALVAQADLAIGGFLCPGRQPRPLGSVWPSVFWPFFCCFCALSCSGNCGPWPASCRTWSKQPSPA